MKLLILCLLAAVAAGQRITTIQLDGVQYFISRMNPYSPELNYFLAYQYCRSLGLQLASFETKEKVQSMAQYLQNAGYSKYDFWTSGNRLGTGMFLWMSTGLPFNATFDYFESSNDAVKAGLLDPVDHNSNTSPQRTARDSSSGLEKGCIMLQAPSLRWAPEDCSAVKDFICEQTRCYYYNYGSIPVSSAQGRPIFSLNTAAPSTSAPTTISTSTITTTIYTTTPIPVLLAAKAAASDDKKPPSSATATAYGTPIKVVIDNVSTESHIEDIDDADKSTDNESTSENSSAQYNHVDEGEIEDQDDLNEHTDDKVSEEIPEQQEDLEEDVSEKVEETTSVEQRLRKITEEIEKFSNSDNESEIHGRQSFFSLSDLIRTLQPGTGKKIAPQIDSDYSKSMHVLGETASIVNGDESRKIKDNDLRQTNRALY